VTRLSALALAALLPILPGASSSEEDPPLPSPAEAKRRWQERLDGVRFSARVTMTMLSGNDSEGRRISVWRDHGSDGERLMARFEEPAELRGLGLLYLEGRDTPNDYFIYQPATRKVRRIPDALAREDVYGIDLEYLGFGVAQIEPTEVKSVRAEDLEGRRTFLLTEFALESNPRFDRRLVWLDPATFIPLRTEHQRGERTTLVAQTREIREIDGIPTPAVVRFDRPQQNQSVEMRVESVDYRAEIPEGVFSMLNLLKR
jgi:hypothetical protein